MKMKKMWRLPSCNNESNEMKAINLRQLQSEIAIVKCTEEADESG